MERIHELIQQLAIQARWDHDVARPVALVVLGLDLRRSDSLAEKLMDLVES